MGKKPLIALAGVCLAGVALCGCQQDRQRTVNGWPKNNTMAAQQPPPGSGSVGAAGWDSRPDHGMSGQPGASGMAGGSGSGMGAAGGSGAGSSSFGGTTFGGASSRPGGSLISGSGSSSAWGQRQAPTGNPADMGQAAGAADSHLADPPPMSGNLTGNPSAAGFPATGAGSSGSLTPPAPPAGVQPPTGGYNLAPPPPPMNSSNVSGYRTVPSGAGDPSLAAPPPVPVMKGNGLDP
jgi:hypothetical protein